MGRGVEGFEFSWSVVTVDWRKVHHLISSRLPSRARQAVLQRLKSRPAPEWDLTMMASFSSIVPNGTDSWIVEGSGELGWSVLFFFVGIGLRRSAHGFRNLSRMCSAGKSTSAHRNQPRSSRLCSREQEHAQVGNDVAVVFSLWSLEPHDFGGLMVSF